MDETILRNIKEGKPIIDEAMLKWINKYKDKFSDGFDRSLPVTFSEVFEVSNG